MLGTRDAFTITLSVPDNDPRKLRDEITEWIKTKNILTKIETTYADNNQIHIKHSVHSVGTSMSVYWRLKPIVIYYLNFVIKDNRFIIDAEIEHTRNPRTFTGDIFWRFKCRDFIFGFFKRIKLDEDPQLLDLLYPRDEIEIYLKKLRQSYTRILLFYHALITVVTLFTALYTNQNIDAIIGANVGVLIMDFITWINYRLDTRRYRKYLNIY